MLVIRLVLQRSLRSGRQPFRTAMACSPGHRILAWVLLCRRFQRLSRRPRKGTRTWRPAPSYALSAQHFSPAVASASMRPCSRAVVRSWVEPGRAAEAYSSRRKGSVMAWTFMPWRLCFPE